MAPAYSSIDSPLVKLGDLADYSVTSAAIPVDVADSSGAITSFTTKHATDTTNAFYAIGERLHLNTGDGGAIDGLVSSVGTPANGVMSLTADTVMARMNVDKRVYPIYRSRGVDNHYVAAAIDHWTQSAGMFYDNVPGRVLTYHSCYGHDYMYSLNPQNRPRMTSWQGRQNYGVFDGRVMYRLWSEGVGNTTALQASSVSVPDESFAPSDTYPIPEANSGEQLVLSPGFHVSGPHNGSFLWSMRNVRRNQRGSRGLELEMVFSTTAGFSLFKREGFVTEQLFSPSGALTNGNYRVLIGMRAANSTQTRFTFRIINETTGAVSTRETTVTTLLRGAQAQFHYAHAKTDASGAAGWGLYGYFASIIKDADMPVEALPPRKQLAATDYPVPLVPGFDGDVWAHVKQLLALHRMDMWFEDGRLCVDKRQRAVTEVPGLTGISPSLSQRNGAKFIEVVNQRMDTHHRVARVFYAADSVYQVATGEVQTFTVQTEHSIDTVNDPACVSGITPYPYKEGVGQYVITGSDGYIVSPEWWSANGGRITARTTEREGEIEITIKGPDYDSVRSPYRVSEGDAGRAALYITGMGVTSNPETLKIPTGNPSAVTDIGETVDIPFITSRDLAYRAAVQVSQRYASPELKLSGKEPKADSENSVLARRGTGRLFEFDGSVYRIGTLTQTDRANSFGDAQQYTTIRHRAEAFPGRTIRQANDDNGRRTIKDRALKPLRSS